MGCGCSKLMILLLLDMAINRIMLPGMCEFISVEEIQTGLGNLTGTRIKTGLDLNKSVSDTYVMFRGIPYALPPTGNRRFEPPEPVQPWSGTRDASRHGPVCPQNEDVWIDPKWPRDEDCLYMSIYMPYKENKTDNTTYPVILFIHGGSYEVGSERLYDGGILSLFGVVVVMINYRLGILGFIASGDDTVAGNYGLLDQIQALKWIREYIHHFSGDPDNVTIMGQSVGSSCVGLLLTSPLAHGLYHRAIMQSGAVLARYSYQSKTTTNVTAHFLSVGEAHNCPPGDTRQIKDCLKTLHWSNLMYKRHWFPENDPVVPQFRPIIDGYVLPYEPAESFTDNHYWKVPVLQGVVKDEMSPYRLWDGPVNFNSDELIPHQLDSIAATANFRVASSLKTHLTDTYGSNLLPLISNYYSNWSPEYGYIMKLTKLIEDIDFIVPSVELSNLLGDSNPSVYQYYFGATYNSYHLVELNYLFGAPFTGGNYDDGYGKYHYNDHERNISLWMMQLWSHFAATGIMSFDDQQLATYDKKNRQYIHIAHDGIHIKNNMYQKAVDFWTQVIPDLININMAASTTAPKVPGNRSCNAESSPELLQNRSCNTAASSDMPQNKTYLVTFILGIVAFTMALVAIVLFCVLCCKTNKHKYARPKKQFQASDV